MQKPLTPFQQAILRILREQEMYLLAMKQVR